MEDFQVYSAMNGQEALDVMEQHPQIDLVVLDIMMPGLSGWDILPYLKENYEACVLMLTALSDSANEVRGLRKGADDYVRKPFSRAVLMERSRRLIRNKHENLKREYCFQELCLDPWSRKVTIGGNHVSLTGREYQLLYLLMSNSNMVMSRDVIIERIWGDEYDVDSRNVDTQIKMLRRSIGKYGEQIRTVRGVGYCFDGEVIHS
jgi:DNA-binding response OmpR family regulator